jgi:undecaprenyl-diphosphatase
MWANSSHRRSSAIVFWVAWVSLLALFISFAAFVDGSYDVWLDNAISEYAWYHHHFFPLSNQYWQLWGLAGEPVTIITLVLALSLLLVIKGHRTAAAVAIASLSSGLVLLLARAYIDRPIDPTVLTNPQRLYPEANSFPSGHAFGESLVLMLVVWFSPRAIGSGWMVALVRAAFVLMVIMGGLQRIVDGNHWPTDILGAYLLALLCVSPWFWLDHVLSRRPAHEPRTFMADERGGRVASTVSLLDAPKQ